MGVGVRSWLLQAEKTVASCLEWPSELPGLVAHQGFYPEGEWTFLPTPLSCCGSAGGIWFCLLRKAVSSCCLRDPLLHSVPSQLPPGSPTWSGAPNHLWPSWRRYPSAPPVLRLIDGVVSFHSRVMFSFGCKKCAPGPALPSGTGQSCRAPAPHVGHGNID